MGVVSHLSLRTTAFDLSLFDYALWNSVHGRLGWVPFIGHSIFSEHFMPVLAVLALPYGLWPSPLHLILLQVGAVGIAALLIVHLARFERIDTFAIVVIVAAFLLSRPSYLAINSFFYPEALQPAFVVGCVLAWRLNRPALYWMCLALLLMTKEDAAVYVATFGIIQCVIDPVRRRQALATVAVAIAWLIFATAIAIPYSRTIDGLPAANHFLTARYGSADGNVHISVLIARVFSLRSAAAALGALGAFGLLSLGAPQWLLVIGPGLIMNLAAKPDTLQATLAGHYYWPILPWVAVAALIGFQRLRLVAPRFAVAWCVLLGIATMATSPMLRSWEQFSVDPAARQTREQLPDTTGLVVAAQPNLVPHLRHDNAIGTLGREFSPPGLYDLFLLTEVGDTWPFSRVEVSRLVEGYRRDRSLVCTASAGPLFIFRRIEATR